jgi:hypothetical protein
MRRCIIAVWRWWYAGLFGRTGRCRLPGRNGPALQQDRAFPLSKPARCLPPLACQRQCVPVSVSRARSPAGGSAPLLLLLLSILLPAPWSGPCPVPPPARDAENQRTAVQSPAGTVGRSCSKKNKLAVTFHWKFSVKKRFTGNSSRKWLFQTRPWHFILRNATLGCVWRMVTHGFFYIGSGLPLSSSSNPAVLEKEIGGGKVARRSYLPCYLHLSTPNEKSNHQ